MNAPLNYKLLARPEVEPDFAIARSRCIDAFVKLEHRVALASKQLKFPVNKDRLGRRVAALAKAKPCSPLSRDNQPKLQAWVLATESLIAKRAWLVHSEMAIGNFDGGWKASFANVVDLVAGTETVMLVSLADLQALRRAVMAKCGELESLISGITPRTKAQPNPLAQPLPASHRQAAAGTSAR